MYRSLKQRAILKGLFLKQFFSVSLNYESDDKCRKITIYKRRFFYCGADIGFRFEH